MWSKIKRFATTNWQAKTVTLLLAIVIWIGVKEGGIEREQQQKLEDGDIILSTP